MTGELDLHLIGEGTHRRLWEVLGAHVDADGGVRFAVWAPSARRVSVVGDWNGWDGNRHPMLPSDAGVWTRPCRRRPPACATSSRSSGPTAAPA